MNDELGSHSLSAAHGDRPSKTVDDRLADRHPEPAAGNSSHKGRILPLERLKDPALELRTDPDPVIPDDQKKPHTSGRAVSLTPKNKFNMSVLFRILYRISQKIRKELRHAHIVTADFIFDRAVDLAVEKQFFLLNLRLEEDVYALDQLPQTAGRFVQIHSSALDPADVKNIIDKDKELLPGFKNTADALIHLLLILRVQSRKRGEPYDCIERSPDIVGHIGQKDRLGLLSLSRLLKRTLQNDLLFELRVKLILNVRQSDKNFLGIRPDLSDFYDLTPVILYTPVCYGPVSEAQLLFPLQRLTHMIGTHDPNELLTVFLEDTCPAVRLHGVRIFRQKHFKILFSEFIAETIDQMLLGPQINKIQEYILPGHPIDNVKPPSVLLLDLLALRDIAHGHKAHDMPAHIISGQEHRLSQPDLLKIPVRDPVLDRGSGDSVFIRCGKIFRRHKMKIFLHGKPIHPSRPCRCHRPKRPRVSHSGDRHEDIRILKRTPKYLAVRDVHLKISDSLR